jgi:hypothetical protein
MKALVLAWLAVGLVLIAQTISVSQLRRSVRDIIEIQGNMLRAQHAQNDILEYLMQGRQAVPEAQEKQKHD